MWGPLGDPLSPLAPVSYKVHWTRGPRQLPGETVSVVAVTAEVDTPSLHSKKFSNRKSEHAEFAWTRAAASARARGPWLKNFRGGQCLQAG